METLKSLTGGHFNWSLPCDVNSSFIPGPNYLFLEEARRNRAMKDKEYTAIDMESENLLEHDSLAPEQAPVTPSAGSYKTEHSLQINEAQVDDPIPLKIEDNTDNSKHDYDVDLLQRSVRSSQFALYSTSCRKEPEEKKVDENGNALHQNPGTKGKKKKIQADKNVVVLTAESVEGHRSDIINDVEKLMQFIGGDQDSIPSGRAKSSVHKSKQLHKQHTEDGGRGKKQRAHSSKGKETRAELKKSNSLGEISTAKLDEFAFSGSGNEKDAENKVVMRQNKGQGDRPKERRSWGNVEPPPIQSLYSNASLENLETAENWVVTKTKKKSKKRRNSVSSGRRQNSTPESSAKQHRAPSPDLRGKSACSVPHSEKSNDSSDADSVHSLPIDGLNAPISYADIAKNSEKLKEKKVSPEKVEIKVVVKEKSPIFKPEPEPRVVVSTTVAEKYAVVTPNAAKSNPPPDVHNIKSFPAIPNNKNTLVSLDKTNFKNNVSGKVKNASPNNKIVNKANNVKVNAAVAVAPTNDIQNDLSIIHSNERDCIQFNAQMMPPDIPDVQTIEKMHFLNRPAARDAEPRRPPSPEPPSANDATPNSATANCDSSERTISEDGEDALPPVIILSGAGNKEVPGLVFGFDVNEQLLNEDVCESFVARFVAPDAFVPTSHNHDKIVNFIGTTWEAVVNQTNGKVQYYSEEC